MIKFNSYSEIKEAYDSGKYNIFYENGDTKYEIRHLGSTIYCHNTENNMGMGAINNFGIDCFYGIEKPEPVKEAEAIEDVSENAEGNG
jgi:hypothetical protein